MLKKIVITGPESSGKTTLARQLAQALNTVWVPEYARKFLIQLGRPYQKKDLLDIAKGQAQSEELLSSQANKYLICDTDILTIKIWSNYKYGQCDKEILKLLENNNEALYLLCLPDFPWKYDPQRENPDSQQDLLEIYRNELNNYQYQFFELEGKQHKRLQKALEYIQRI